MTTNYRKEGASYLARWNISPVRDEDGEITHFISVQQDMTDDASSEQISRIIARALDATTESAFLTDAKAKIIFINSAFA